MKLRSLFGSLPPVLAGLALACGAPQPGDTATGESAITTTSGAAGASTTYSCQGTTSGGAREDNTVTISENGYVSMTRKYTMGERTSTGTLQGFATVASGNLTGLSDSQQTKTFKLGDFGFAIGLDGSNPRMLVHGSIPCQAQ